MKKEKQKNKKPSAFNTQIPVKPVSLPGVPSNFNQFRFNSNSNLLMHLGGTLGSYREG